MPSKVSPPRTHGGFLTLGSTAWAPTHPSPDWVSSFPPFRALLDPRLFFMIHVLLGKGTDSHYPSYSTEFSVNGLPSPGTASPPGREQGWLISRPWSLYRAWHTVGTLGDYHKVSTLAMLNELNWTQSVFLKACDGITGGPQDDVGRT